MEAAMTRQMYEDEASWTREDSFRRDIEHWTGKILNKLPISYRVDYAVTLNGKVVGFTELKCRGISSTKYRTLILSLGKWQALLDLQQSAPNLRSNLAVRFTDTDLWLPVFPETREIVEVRWGGRKDRDDWQDMEPVVHLPIKDFIRFNKKQYERETVQ